MGASPGCGLRAFGVTAAVAACMLLAGCGTSRERAAPPARSAQRAAATWSLPNADLANTRRLDTAIDAADVRRLHVVWSVPLTAMHAATPVVSHGVAYTADLSSNVYAIDLASGRVRWRKAYELTDTGPNGVNVADGRLFGVTPEAAFALDPATGRALWTTKLVRLAHELVVMTPGYDDGIVYVSTVPGTPGVVSTLWALDARSGRRLWRWEQVSRAQRWHGGVVGGGGLWHPPAFDGRGGLYVDVANPVPWPGTPEAPWGRSRPGPNRWNNSLVKLDARTGRFIWATQVGPHDLYDWDLETPPILAQANGRAVVLSSGKMGVVYAFDAESGRLLWRTPVGIHNGHDDDSVRAMHGDYSNLGYGRRIYPGDQGGVETQMASDGSTVYVPVNNLYAIYHGQTLPEMQDLLQGTGELVALDVASGRVRWDRRLPRGEYGGATVTNDLVLTTTYDGTVWALDRATGTVVWRAALPAGSISPVMVSGDRLLAAGSVTLTQEQQMRLVGFALGAGRG